MRSNRADIPPDGFENEIERKPNGKSITYLRCSKKAINPLTKKLIQCSYRIRKDHYRQSKHKCSFMNLDEYLSSKKHTIQDRVLDLDQAVYNFVGKSNISISTAVSKEFNELLMAFYMAGQLNPSKPFETNYHQLSRPNFTKNFIVNAEIMKTSILKMFKGFVSLQIDGGKVGPNSILNCVISNPNNSMIHPFYSNQYSILMEHVNLMYPK